MADGGRGHCPGSFEEVIMEGSGCIADRLEPFLKLRFRLAANSDAIETAEPVRTARCDSSAQVMTVG
jgi:Zn-dependent M28 family amino/carboxypeptidase